MNAQNTANVLQQTLKIATDFLADIDQIPPNVPYTSVGQDSLPFAGLGFDKTMAIFQEEYAAAISARSRRNMNYILWIY